MPCHATGQLTQKFMTQRSQTRSKPIYIVIGMQQKLENKKLERKTSSWYSRLKPLQRNMNNLEHNPEQSPYVRLANFFKRKLVSEFVSQDVAPKLEKQISTSSNVVEEKWVKDLYIMRKSNKEENKKFNEVLKADKKSSQQLANTLDELMMCHEQVTNLHNKVIERYDQFKWTLENENKEIEARDQELTDEMINEIRKNMKQLYKQYAMVKDSLVKRCKDEEIVCEREQQEINKKLKEI